MTTHHISSKNWQAPLATAIRTAKHGDKIVVPTVAIKGATMSALPILRGEENLNITVEVEDEATV